MNNKGFMLAEVIIVTSVLIGVMVSLYSGFNKLYTYYNTRSKYYDVDGIYAAKTLENFYIDNLTMDKIIKDMGTNNYFQLPVNNITDGTNLYVGKNYLVYNDIISKEFITDAYIIKTSSLTVSNSLKIANAKETLNDYLNFLSNNEKYDGYTYILVVEIERTRYESKTETGQYDSVIDYYARLRIK